MELLQSKRLKLPDLYFLSDREEIKDLPIGVPFIYGDISTKSNIIRLLEYEVLYKKAVESGLPFNFKGILRDEGFSLVDFGRQGSGAYIDHTTDETMKDDYDLEGSVEISSSSLRTSDFIEDLSVHVDIDKLKQLRIMPTWLADLETAVSTNVHNFATYDYNLYNKKLGGMYGAMTFTPQPKNLIVIDISGSIPRGVSSTCLTIAKNLAESFYADIIITGGTSELYEYENISSMDVEHLYKKHGMNNDQVCFKAILEKEERVYETAIVFGDNDHPGTSWGSSSGTISNVKGQKLCKWKINKLISAHTDCNKTIAGYGRWFSPKVTEHITDWVKYLD